METYVDRSPHTGRSLVAANWLRIGQSQGRGRSSSGKNDRPQSTKDVWVWQWTTEARAQLQQRPLPPVVPRSVFTSSPDLSWIEQEVDGLDLGHVTLVRRMSQMLQARYAHPQQSYFASFGNKTNTNAAYEDVLASWQLG